MPRVNIWIRNEDWEKWQAIADKPEWLHEHLNDIGIRTAIALEDIKQGQAGTVMANPIPVTDIPYLENARDTINNAQIDKLSAEN